MNAIKYGGKVCCRYCRQRLSRGRLMAAHLIEKHRDVAAEAYRGRVT